MNPQVDQYLAEGCGRCPFGGTPDCKVNRWREELNQLRLILLDTGLTEEVKWSVPCYTFEGKNILTMSALKAHCAVGFFKGALLSDAEGLLEKPGKNTQAARVLTFSSIPEILEKEHILRDCIGEAIQVEKKGLKVEFKPNPDPVPEELQRKLNEDLVFKEAFEALTPGRQRGYILYFSGAKQSKTRESRIEKYTPKIMKGKGFHDR